MTETTSDSASSGHTLAESPTTSEPQTHHLQKKTPLDRDLEAEREFADYGGDFPTPVTKFAPGTAEARLRDPNQPHNPPNFRQPTRERRLSRSSYRRPRANTGGSEWSYGDGPSLHVVDSAFADCHRALSRRSLERHEEEEHSEEDETDPNKVEWLENDPENPQNWSQVKKWRVMAICCFLTLGVTFASSAPSSSTQLVAAEFGVGTVVGALTTATFLLGYCLGPLIFAPASELFGRRIIFLISMAVFGIFQIQCGLAKNIETIVIGRFLAGSFASSPLTNCGGVVADMFGPIQRGVAMSVFSASVFLGPVLGPILGGFTIMNSSLGWRYVYLWIGIWAAISVVLIFFLLPETYHPQLLKNRAQKLRKEGQTEKYADIEKADFSLKSIIVRTGARPFQMLATEPILLLVTIYLSVVYGLLYGLFSLFPVIWERKRGFNPGEGGLIFIGVGLGTTIGAAANVYMQRHYRELVPKWHGHPPPEERLYGAILAGPLLVCSMFWLSWTGNYSSIHWVVPALSTIMLGASFSLVFISFLSYLVEVYLMFSASGLAANTIVRSAVAASFPLWISQAISAIGVNWLGTIFACIGILIAPSPILFYFYGSRLRQGSKFAPALDLKFKDQVEKEEREKKDANEKA
ncbi:hypothetical protein JCM3765_005993 [Sporobolomyces pararoseus]